MDYRYAGLGVGSVPPQIPVLPPPPGTGGLGGAPLGDPSQQIGGAGPALPPPPPSSLLQHHHPSLMFHYG